MATFDLEPSLDDESGYKAALITDDAGRPVEVRFLAPKSTGLLQVPAGLVSRVGALLLRLEAERNAEKPPPA